MVVMDSLPSKIGYEFQDTALLEKALTHSSAALKKHRGFDRLEFLGDRVLGLVVAEMLLHHYPKAKEGEIAKRHVALVRREQLAKVARAIDLAASIVQSGSTPDQKLNESILADVMEALIGAVYQDGGLAAARQMIERLWGDDVESLVDVPRDSKTTLQEMLQSVGSALPVYKIIDRQGAEHAPQFLVRVRFSYHGQDYEFTGCGGSKREGEQEAAMTALQTLEKKS